MRTDLLIILSFAHSNDIPGRRDGWTLSPKSVLRHLTIVPRNILRSGKGIKQFQREGFYKPSTRRLCLQLRGGSLVPGGCCKLED